MDQYIPEPHQESFSLVNVLETHDRKMCRHLGMLDLNEVPLTNISPEDLEIYVEEDIERL